MGAFKAYTSIIKFKVASLFNSRNCFSAMVIRSKYDSTCTIRQKCRIHDSEIGKYTYICRNTLMQNTQIGNFCAISEGCNIGMPSHPIDMVSTSPVFLSGTNYLKKNFSVIPYEDCPRTVIGNDVWIGAHVQIKSGIKIGNGAVLAAGAVVTHDVPDYAVVGGVPAKIMKYRFDENTIHRLLALQWWNWSDEVLAKCGESFISPKALLDLQEVKK